PWLMQHTARRPLCETPPAVMSQAMRCVSTRVLPLPAPASTSTGPSGAVTAARCASFSGLRMGDKSMGGAFYTVKTRAYGKAPEGPAARIPAGVHEKSLGGCRHALLREARQRNDEAQQHGPDDEPEDSPRGRAADRADEQRKRRHLGVMRG